MARQDILQILDRLDASEDLTVARVDAGPALASRVAVLPASFNPPTKAHVELLERAQDVPGIATSVALLTTRNVDKGLMGAGHAERLEMLLALALRSAGVLVSNAARIADQAATLRSAFPAHQFDFVVGYDTLIRLFDPGYYHGDMDDVLGPYFVHHRLIAATRGPVDLETMERYLETEPEARRYASRIIPLDLGDDFADVSSTHARQAVPGAARDLPPPIAAYIREQGLYRS